MRDAGQRATGEREVAFHGRAGDPAAGDSGIRNVHIIEVLDCATAPSVW